MKGMRITTAVLVVLAAAIPAAAQTTVFVNEIHYDNDGTDTGEAIEIAGPAGTDLTGWSLVLYNGSNGAPYNTTSLLGTIADTCGGYGALDFTYPTNGIQNGSPDGIALVDAADAVVQFISYEGSFTAVGGPADGLTSTDIGVAEGTSTPVGDSLQLTGTGVVYEDFAWAEAAVATFGACNTGQVFGTPTVSLVINEIDYDQAGTDAAEFIEIKNTGSSAVNLGAFTIDLINGTGGGASIYQSFALPAVALAAGDFFVVCADAAATFNCDLDVSPDTNLIQNGAPDAVALMQGATLIDTVSYEGDTGTPYTEGSGAGLVDDPGIAFLGISRFPDGVDTGQNNVDLSPRCITPGTANIEASTGCNDPFPAPSGLVINEIDYDQDGTDAAEFVELKNPGADPVNLGSFSLEFVNGSNGAVYDTIVLPPVDLAPGGYFVVCANAATVYNCDLDDGPDTNFIQNGAPDAVALWQGATLIDTVSYEGDTVAPFTEGSGAGLFDDPGIAFLGISRFPDGIDTGQNNQDFSPRCITPGEANSAATSGCFEPGPPSLVINEIDYDQPGSDTAEFIEIKNTGSSPVDLGGFSLDLVTGSDTSVYSTIALPSVDLAPGDYFVVCADATTVLNCDLDVAPDSNLIQNGAPDAVALVQGATIIDTVSYEGDTGAPYTEGSGSGLEDSGASGNDFKGISRLPDGTDSDQNNVDFAFVCITPGAPNTPADFGCTAAGPVVEIFDIQGSGLSSPFEGTIVTTADNVVTAVGLDGFFMQTPAARADGNIDTSDGIFVYTDTAPTVSVGDQVDVTGAVQEFFGFTEFSGSPAVTIDSSANPLPSPVALDASVPSPDPTTPTCAIEFECYEGMLVAVVGGAVTGPNQRFNPDPIAEVYITAAPDRTFREPGVEYPGLSMPPIPTWDGNPEVFELDPDRLGLPNQIIPAGSAFSATGVIGYEFNGYELWPFELEIEPAPLPVPVRPRASNEFTVGSLNLFRLFDDVDDPPTANANGEVIRNDTVVSAAEYMRRRAKLAAYILDVLDAPDILAVQEAEKIEVLQDLAADIAAADPGVVYTAWLIEGNDIGTIDVGFLTRDTIAVDAVTQYGYTTIFSYDGSLLNDRPPLMLEARAVAGGADTPVKVIVVHNRSLGSIDDPANGERVREKRLAQAQFVAQLVQDEQAADPDVALAVVGDFNAYEFTDGYVDVVGQIAGDFVPEENLLFGLDLVDPNLTKRVLTLPAEARYSYTFEGSAQTLDHALTSAGLDPLVTGFEFGRGNADAAVDLINDGTTPAYLPLRSSDHDGLVLYVTTDLDGDGVPDNLDFCPGTVIPESVPTVELGTNRWALVDGDGIFDTNPPNGLGAGLDRGFTIEETAGCSCEQIIDELHLGNGHTKFGCSTGAIENWIEEVQD